MDEIHLPERCGICPFFTQKFTQELRKKGGRGTVREEVMTGLCGAMRLTDIKAKVPRYEITHRRSADSPCYFSIQQDTALAVRVSWLVERQRALLAHSGSSTTK